MTDNPDLTKGSGPIDGPAPARGPGPAKGPDTTGGPDPTAATVTTAKAPTINPDEFLGRASGFSLDSQPRSVRNAVIGYSNRVRSGDPGALPSLLGIVVLGFLFSKVSDRFLSLNNIGNLPGQSAYIAVIAMGLIFVLLLGEIDLSAGTAGGVCAGFAAQALFSGGLKQGVSGVLFWILIGFMVVALLTAVYLKAYTGAAVVLIGLLIVAFGLEQHVIGAMIFAVTIGTAIGILTGWLVAKVGIPSFIVTLALFLAWQGVLLFALKSQPVGIQNYPYWYGLANNNMSNTWSWVFTIVVLVGYLGYTLWRAQRARTKGLIAESVPLVLIRGGVVAAIGIVLTIFACRDRNPNIGFPISGIPWAMSIPIVLMIVCNIALTKSPWGRHLFATGGNVEAARRAGIDVVHIRVTAFTVCSSFAALGGLFLSSSTGGAQLDLGSGNILLFSVAAAVIGGTSLFGGRGKPRDAIIGALVIGMIPNGIGLKPSLPAQWQTVITGAVLLVAAAVDALSRRSSSRR
ncbi:MAG: ABC transporter permease [Actinomycetota bacterium]|nr:ABC transporter permease [Actinomycetota bacterium]